MDINYILILLHKSVLYIEGLSFLIGLFYIKKYWHTSAKYVPLYLFLVVCVEYYGLNAADDMWIYNVLGIAELLIFSYIFYHSVKELYSKKIIILACLLGVASFILDLIFISKDFNVFLSYAFGFISIMISLICFVFLFEMMKTEKVLHQFRVLLYWVVIGLLIFHLCNLPITILANHIIVFVNTEVILMIQTLASIALYFCFIIGFIWTKRQYNS